MKDLKELLMKLQVMKPNGRYVHELSNLIFMVSGAIENGWTGKKADDLHDSVSKRISKFGSSRSTALKEKLELFGADSFYPLSEKIDIKVGKEYLFAQKFVQVMSLNRDTVEIQKVVRGMPTPPSIEVPIAKFYREISGRS